MPSQPTNLMWYLPRLIPMLLLLKVALEMNKILSPLITIVSVPLILSLKIFQPPTGLLNAYSHCGIRKGSRKCEAIFKQVALAIVRAKLEGYQMELSFFFSGHRIPKS